MSAVESDKKDKKYKSIFDSAKNAEDSNIIKTFSAISEGARNAAASVDSSSSSITKGVAAIGGGIKGLWTSLSAFGKIGLIAGIGYGIYKIADALIVTGEEAKQAMTDSFETYKSSTASVDELNSKLSETKAKINELSTKGGLTIVEQGELDKLNEQNKLLQMELDLKEKIARNDAISAGESAVTSFKKNYGAGITTKDVQDKITEYEDGHGDGSFSRLNEDTILEAETYFHGEDLKTNLFKYKAYQQAYQNMLKDPGAQLEDIQAASDNVDAMKSLIDEEALGLIDILKNINDLPVEVKNREDIKGAYEAAKNSLNAIYEITDPAKWEQTKLDDFLSRNSIFKQKQQLLDKAKDDKYKGISISDLSESLRQAAENAGIQDLQTIVDAINSEAGVFDVEEAKKSVEIGKKSAQSFLGAAPKHLFTAFRLQNRPPLPGRYRP